MPLAFFLLYAATAQHGVAWQDSGKMQYRILAGDYTGWEGTALAHPLYIGMARAWGWLLQTCGWRWDVFWGMNLFSALGMGGAAALVWQAAASATGRREAGMFAAVLFGFAHMPWWMGTITETYAWGAAFHAAEWCVLVALCKRMSAGRNAAVLWCALGLLNGLHLSLANTSLLNLPVYGGLWVWGAVKRKTPWWTLPAVAAFWLAGAAWWWREVLGVMLHHGFYAGLTDGLFGENYAGHVLGGRRFFGPFWLPNMMIFALNFLSPLWLLAVWGWVRARTRWRDWHMVRIALAALLCIHALFFLRYPIADQATFAIPTVALLAIAGGAGIARASHQWRGRVKAVLLLLGTAGPVLLYAAAGCGLGELYARGAIPRKSRELPYRDEIRYWALPWKQNEASAQEFVDEAEKIVHDGDMLFADATVASSLMAARALRASPDAWRLLSPWTGETPGQLLALMRQPSQRVFIVSPVRGYAPDALLKAMRFEKEGILYRVREGE
ncbi:MAG: hypothetical protein FWG50_03420 [Kiritimatiellaeota bacterium]|nr:hypothetical protein [Kiritimatiellota bacterium]